jgi:deaminated glutathione amidase
MSRSTRRDVIGLAGAVSMGLTLPRTVAAEDLPQRPATSTAPRAPGDPPVPPAAATSRAATPARGPRIEPYRASCVQTRVLPTFDAAGAFRRDALDANVATVAAAIERGAGEVGARLYSFSEFCLQASEQPVGVRDWIGASVRVPGLETDVIAKAAQRARAFVGINVTELIPQFPGRYFLSGVILGPTGNVVLNYRKLYDLTTKTRPSDVWTAWLDKMGPESVFPVADTEIGRLASIVALDVNWPEMARNFVFNGAEVLLNPTASPLPPGSVAPDIRSQIRRVRAFENIAYVLLSNLGPVGPDVGAAPPSRVPSEIIDFRGQPLATARDSNEAFITATIDVEALRKARTTPNSQNWLVELQADVHRQGGYDRARFFPVDTFPAAPMENSSDYDAIKTRVVDDLVARDVLRRPAS